MLIGTRMRGIFAAGVSLSAMTAAAFAQNAPIIQPGAPGTAAKSIGAAEASEIANTSYSAYDVEFMQDMILHHQQAVDMAALVASRTNSKDLNDIAGRINVSQADEIRFMRDWLTSRGETPPDPKAHDAMHVSHKMAGMASPEDMQRLAEAKGVDSTGFS